MGALASYLALKQGEGSRQEEEEKSLSQAHFIPFFSKQENP